MNKQTNSAGAFSLVEVALAIGVAAFCLIAILGFLPAGLNTNQTSTRQTTANGILSSIVADLRATPATAPPGQSTTSSLFGINFQGSTPTLYFAADGRVVPKGDPNAVFYATVKFSKSGGGPSGDSDEEGGSNSGSGTASFADVKVGWPAAAGAGGSGGDDSDTGGDNDNGSGSGIPSSSTAGSVETFVGLDRNTGSTGGGGG